MKNKDKKSTEKKQTKTNEVVNAFVRKSSLRQDSLGSYTGKPRDPGDVPTQDADDL